MSAAPRLVKGAAVVPMLREDVEGVEREAEALRAQFERVEAEILALRFEAIRRRRREGFWIAAAILGWLSGMFR